MLTRLLTIALLAVAVTITGPAWSYDSAMAESYATLFKTKIKCRSNMKNILSAEQFTKVQEIYTGNLLARHAN